MLPRRVLSSECLTALLFGGLSLHLVCPPSNWLIHSMLFSLRPLSSLGYTIRRNIVLPQDQLFLSRLYEIYLSIKDLEILAKFRLSQILHLCTQKSVCAANFGTFLEKLALIFLHNFHRNHILLTLKIKKLSLKINVKNIKKTRV